MGKGAAKTKKQDLAAQLLDNLHKGASRIKSGKAVPADVPKAAVPPPAVPAKASKANPSPRQAQPCHQIRQAQPCQAHAWAS